MPVCPSVRLHATTRLPLDGFSWNFIFNFFSKICRERSRFIKIWQEEQVLHMKTDIHVRKYLAEFLLEGKVFQTKLVNNNSSSSNTHTHTHTHSHNTHTHTTHTDTHTQRNTHTHTTQHTHNTTHTHTHTQRNTHTHNPTHTHNTTQHTQHNTHNTTHTLYVQ